MRRAVNVAARPVRRRSAAGFALLIVIWGLGLIALLATTFTGTARMRVQVAFNLVAAAQAELAADAAINGAILAMIKDREASLGRSELRVYDGSPEYCALQTALAVREIQDESGKVDLNAASSELLQAMFKGFGRSRSEADRLTRALLFFRATPSTDLPQKFDDYAADGRPFGPKQAVLQSALELDQLIGMDDALFRALLPHVTVYTRRAGVDPQTASPALFAALAGFGEAEVRAAEAGSFGIDRQDPRFPGIFRQSGSASVYTVRAEALLPGGQAAAREAVVDLLAAQDSTFVIREWRRTPPRRLEKLREMARGRSVRAEPC